MNASIESSGPNFRRVSDDYGVSAQLHPADMPTAAAAGYRSILNNRPDFEGGPEQPTSAQLESAARAAGLAYAHLPLALGDVGPADVARFQKTLNTLPAPVLSFCGLGGRAARLHELAARGTGQQGSIAGRLIMWFLVIAFLSCGVLALALDRISSHSVEQTYYRNLVAISQRKIAALESYASDLIRSVYLTGRTREVIEPVPALRAALDDGGPNTPAYRAAESGLRRVLSNVAGQYGFVDATLFDLDGRVIFSLNRRIAALTPGLNLSEGALRNSELAGVYDRVKTLLQEEISDMRIYEGSPDPVVFVAGPVLHEGVLVGVLAFQIDNEELYWLIEDHAGLGDTGETVVLTRIGNDAVVVAPLRHAADAAFRQRIALGSPNGAASQAAIRGQRGHGRRLDYRGIETLAVWSYVPSFRWGLNVKQDATEALAMVQSQRRLTLLLLLLGAIPISVAAVLVAHSISKPLVQAAKVAEQVAAGDLTRTFSSAGRADEVGVLLAVMANMITHLRGLLRKIKSASVEITHGADDVSATARSQEAGVSELSGTTAEIAAAVREISSTGRELLGSMRVVSERVDETAALADAGREGVSAMNAAIGELDAASSAINERLKVIAAKAQNINGVVLTITKVADQTNLLSLNAAIEAEKAGEVGRGFAIVAREIRRLADQTAVGTLDIEQMVAEMQAAVSAGVREMAQFGERVARGVAAASVTNEQLGRIIAQVQELKPRFEFVSQGMQAQSAGAQQITGAMQQLNEMAQATSQSIGDLMKATQSMHTAVAALGDEVGRFRTDD